MFTESPIPASPRQREVLFSPGHLGELTQVITAALVDEALVASRRMQQRIRLLPSRVTVYFILALSLFEAESYRGVWSSLVAGLPVPAVDPSESALRQARRRIGSGPLRMLFDRLRGPLADPATTGSWWRGLRLVAWDGTSLQVADSTANLTHFGRHNTCHGPGGFPSLQLSALVECGTRALLDAVFGPAHTPENQQNQQLCRSLAPGMLLLADRASAGYPLMRRAVTAGAELLWRLKDNRVLPPVHVLPDDSFLTMVCDVRDRDRLNYWMKHPRPVPPQVTGIAVRVVEADIMVTGPDGQTRISSIRLLTTLLDPVAYPAEELVRLYHERWEAETVFYGLKVTLRGSGRILRSHAVEDVHQEVFSLLAVYQAARHVMVRAAAQAGLDSDRISLTVTLRAARLTVIAGQGRTEAGTAEPVVARIISALLNPRELHPDRRRSRSLPRKIKKPISRFAYSPTKHNKPWQKVRIDIEITTSKTSLRRRSAA